jgi:hypothetical protein
VRLVPGERWTLILQHIDVPDLHQPFISTSLFTPVSLHQTFLLIKPKEPAAFTSLDHYTLLSTTHLHPSIPTTKLTTITRSTLTSTRLQFHRAYNGHDTPTACGIRRQWSPTAPQDEHRIPFWPSQRRHRDDRQLLCSRSCACAYPTRNTDIPDALLPV